jgi:uncharacterized membrane protein YbhN (UPF0104 family)
VAALLLAILLLQVDPVALLHALARPSWAILAAAGGAILGGTLIAAFNSYLLINCHQGIRFRDYLPIYWLAWAAGLLLPGQVGDLVVISSLIRRHEMEWHTSLGRTLVDKAISFLVVSGFAFIGLVGLDQAHLFRWPALSWVEWGGLGVLLALALAGLAARLPRLLAHHAERPGPLGLIARTLREIGAVARLHPARMGINLVLTAARTLIVGGAYWLVFLGTGQAVPPLLETACLASASGLVAYLPISLNGIGTVEWAGVALFGLRGIPAVDVVSSYLLLRLLVMGIALLPAGICYALLRPATPAS